VWCRRAVSICRNADRWLRGNISKGDTVELRFEHSRIPSAARYRPNVEYRQYASDDEVRHPENQVLAAGAGLTGVHRCLVGHLLGVRIKRACSSRAQTVLSMARLLETKGGIREQPERAGSRTFHSARRRNLCYVYHARCTRAPSFYLLTRFCLYRLPPGPASSGDLYNCCDRGFGEPEK